MDFRFQSPMHRAAFRYFEQPLFLFFVQIAAQLDYPIDLVHRSCFRFAVTAILGVDSRMREANCDPTQVDTFALRVQAQCHGRAGSQAGKD